MVRLSWAKEIRYEPGSSCCEGRKTNYFEGAGKEVISGRKPVSVWVDRFLELPGVLLRQGYAAVSGEW
jgi:hypothetical protein